MKNRLIRIMLVPILIIAMVLIILSFDFRQQYIPGPVAMHGSGDGWPDGFVAEGLLIEGILSDEDIFSGSYKKREKEIGCLEKSRNINIQEKSREDVRDAERRASSAGEGVSGIEGAEYLKKEKKPEKQSIKLVAGAYKFDISPDISLPLGGYISRRGNYDSIRDPVHGRVMIIDPGRGGYSAVALVNLDILVVPPKLAAEVEKKAMSLIPDIGLVIVTATHTHAGPGAVWNSRIAGIAGMGRFSPDYYNDIINRITGAVEKAWLSRETARIDVISGNGPPICRNSVSGREADRRLDIIRFDGDEGLIGRIVVFSCHPTFLGSEDFRLSAEWPGETERRLDGVTLLLPGAIGDQRPCGFDRERLGLGADEKWDISSREGRMVAAGAAVAESVLNLENRKLRKQNSGTNSLESFRGFDDSIAWRSLRMNIPSPTGEFLAPYGLRNATGNILSALGDAELKLSMLRLEDAVLFFIPGETVSSLAAKWESDTGNGSLSVKRIISLADGYQGYFEDSHALNTRSGESGNAWLDESAISRIGKGLRAMSITMDSMAIQSQEK